MYYIYLHYTLDTNKVFYVGKGTKRPNRDTFTSIYYRAHSLQGRNNFWKRVSNKHGYRIEIHSEYENEQDAFNKEMELISLYGRRDLNKGYLVNVTDGGEGESGREFTEAHKKKISESKKGKKLNYTEEGRLRKIESLKGKNNPFYGKSHSDKNIRFYVVSQSTKIEMISPDGDITIFECLKDCADFFGKSPSTLRSTMSDMKRKPLTPKSIFYGYEFKRIYDKD